MVVSSFLGFLYKESILCQGAMPNLHSIAKTDSMYLHVNQMGVSCINLAWPASLPFPCLPSLLFSSLLVIYVLASTLAHLGCGAYYG